MHAMHGMIRYICMHVVPMPCLMHILQWTDAWMYENLQHHVSHDTVKGKRQGIIYSMFFV
jgi:hypothetical protein